MGGENIDKNIELMKIDILDIIKYLYSDSLNYKNIEDLNKYIENLNANELIIFKQISEDLKYQKKYLGCNKYKITQNSINLSIKIFQDTQITTFPYIDRIACKGYSISDGTFAWGMYKLNDFPATKIYSNFRTRECIQKKVILEHNRDIYGSDCIDIKD